MWRGISRQRVLKVMKLDENTEGGSADTQWGGPEAESWHPPPGKVSTKSKKRHRSLRRRHR